jgi:hypothetical protein
MIIETKGKTKNMALEVMFEREDACISHDQWQNFGMEPTERESGM